MGAWETVSILKGFAIFDVNPNTSFNVESLTGNKFSNPQVYYGFKKLVANVNEWNGTLSLSGSYPNYSINTNGTISNSSIINVLIYEV